MKILLLAVLPLAGVPATSFAQGPLTFDAAVSMALERAPQVEMQRAALDAAQALRVSAGRLPDPAAIVGVDNLPLSGPDRYSLTRDFMTMTKVGVMQTVPSAARRASERGRASAEITLAEADLAATRATVARQAAVAWLRVATAHQARQDLESLEPDLALGASAARGSLRGGQGSASDALSAEAALAALRSRLLQLRGDEKRAEAELARWVGTDAIAVAGPLPSLDDLPNRPDILRESAHLHVDIAPLDARIAVAEADVQLARAARRPGWGVELAYAKRGPDYSDMASLQFSVDLPLFARNRQDPVIAARSADLRRARAERESELAMHTAELHQVVISWQQLGEQLDFLEKEQLPLARERSRATLGGYRAGNASVASLIDAVSAETELRLSRSALTLERGIAWSYLRYLQPLSEVSGSAP